MIGLSGNNIALTNLTVTVAAGYAKPEWSEVANVDYIHSDAKITNVCITADTGQQGVQGFGPIYRTEISGCVFDVAGSVGGDGWIHDSTFHGAAYFDAQNESALTMGTRDVIENNQILTPNWPNNGGNRNYLDFIPVDQLAHMVWAKRLAIVQGNNGYLAHNTATDVAVQDNRGEMILFHGYGGRWFGNVISSNVLTVTLRTDGLVDGQVVTINNYGVPLTGGQPVPPWSQWSNDVLIITDGKGRGQMRSVVSRTPTTVTVDRPWTVQPDSTSKAVIPTREYASHIIYQNDLNAFPSGYLYSSSASIAIDIDGNGWANMIEGNTSHRTQGSRSIIANGGGPSYWNEMRGEQALDLHCNNWGDGLNAFWWDANPTYPVSMANTYRGCSMVSVDSPGNSGANASGLGNIFENTTITSKVGYGLFGTTPTGSYTGDGFVLYRNGNVTVQSCPGTPATPKSVTITWADGRQCLINNTYSGATQTYWLGDLVTSYTQPLAPIRVARFKGYKDTLLSDVVIPIANAGIAPVTWSVTGKDSWITATVQQNGTLSAEKDNAELGITIDQSTLSVGVTWGSVTLTGGGQTFKVGVRVELAASAPTTGLQIWLKSNAGITKDGSNYVGTWADQSGGGRNVTQSTQNYKPLWVNNVVNGYPVIRFAGNDDVLKTASGVRPINGTTAFTTFTVNKWISFTLTNSYQRMWWEGSTSTTNGYGLYINSATTPKIKASWGSSSGLMTDSGTEALGKWYQTITTYDQSNHKMWVNGAYIGSAAKTGSNINTGVLNVGNYNTNNQGFNGDMTELLMYNRVLASSEQAQVQAYLNAK